ncbi:MAG: hypothetical protein KTR16_02610 [Acidiferrobacterales bacterium]|nr:hypothetical protein [Acidiferrobacterales bacterium]
MIKTENDIELQSQKEVSFDDLMASLFVLITHYSLNNNDTTLSVIVDRLEVICKHSEIELYPNQLVVLGKMRQLWRTKLFNVQISEVHH